VGYLSRETILSSEGQMPALVGSCLHLGLGPCGSKQEEEAKSIRYAA
jgi:hypothetical protein